MHLYVFKFEKYYLYIIYEYFWEDHVSESEK